jgi:hypothetical protein
MSTSAGGTERTQVRAARLELPPFYCPIESAIHPEVDAIEQRAIDWIDRSGLCETDAERGWVLVTNSAEFYARFAPAGVEDNVLAAALWVYWGFAFDDACCDNGPLSTRPAAFEALASRLQLILDAPEDPIDSSDRFALSLRDIALTLRRHATPQQLRRFSDAHRYWLSCVAWQISNQTRGYMPDLAEYTAMRLGSCGGPPTLALLEIANAMEVPASEMQSSAVRALTAMGWFVAGWDNDLHSYNKEAHQQDSEQNVVNVLVHHHGQSVEQALLSAVGMRDRVMHLFLRLREKTLAHASEPLRSYLISLGHGIRGNIDWALRVPRYTSLGDLSAVPGSARARQPRWTDEPSDTSFEPLPIPVISWWWDQLDV